ncbi:MAG TPA: hypothetical protein VG328_13355 [Stellaceae bacterium]|nr:hypothetical protein [Stellaceae bacterium]
MPVFRLPLSGNVTQSINPWNWVFNPTGGQFGLVNIALGQSSNPAVEEEVLTDVASYGKQLGRIEDALLLLIARAEKTGELSDEEKQAFAALRHMTGQIAAVKAKHGAPGAPLSPVPPAPAPIAAETPAPAPVPAETPAAAPLPKTRRKR